MLKSLALVEIQSPFLSALFGALFTLVVTGLVWLLKSAYENHRNEQLLLKKYEMAFAFNVTYLHDNLSFIDSWINSLSQNRPYKVHFSEFIVDNESAFNITDLTLINKLLSLNYMLERSNYDLKNISESYWEIILKIDSIENAAEKEASLRRYHQTVQETLKNFRKNYVLVKSDILDTTAYIRMRIKIRSFSIFNLLRVLHYDLYPRVSEKKHKKYIENLKDEIAKKLEKKEK